MSDKLRAYHGAHEQALNFALNVHDDKLQTYEFLKAWNEGALDEWPEFYTWLDEHSLRPPSTDATVEDDVREMLAALVSARETLRLIAINRQKYGAIATKCQSLGFELTRATELLAALQLRSPRADAAEARVRELEKELAALQAADALMWQNRALAAEVERDKLREVARQLLEIVDCWELQDQEAVDAREDARQALASITDEKSAESGRVE